MARRPIAVISITSNHIEVEDVAGQEGPVDAGEHAQQQGWKPARLATADVGQTEGHHCGGQNPGDRHHRCRQGIGDEDYAERRRPVAEADRQNPSRYTATSNSSEAASSRVMHRALTRRWARRLSQAGCQPSTENRQQDRPEWCVQRQKSCHGRSCLRRWANPAVQPHRSAAGPRCPGDGRSATPGRRKQSARSR